jgi:hypothetical protein
MSNRDFAHRLQMKFGLSYTEPTDFQISQIRADVLRIVNQQGRQPTLAEWTRIVGSYCRSIGTHARMGVDNTDLNLLLQLAIQSGK